MKNLIWKDATSYSQNDKERIPRVFETKASDSAIIVHRHIYYPRTWLLTCRDLEIEQMNLHTDELEKAKTIAISKVVERALELVVKMGMIAEELGGNHER